EKATRELAALQERAEPSLRQAVNDESISAEVRRRARELLEGLEDRVPPPQALREARALEVLEQISNPTAVELLQRLAGGDPAARIARRAKESLDRLSAMRPELLPNAGRATAAR